MGKEKLINQKKMYEMKKNITFIMGLIVFIVTSIAAALPNKAKPPKYKNLKVLPKNISEAALDKIMDSYNVALGVTCDYCHTKNNKTSDLIFESESFSCVIFNPARRAYGYTFTTLNLSR